MTTPRIFKINDCDWWMAPTKEQAIADYRKDINNDPDDSDTVREVTEEEMDRLHFCFRDGPSRTEMEEIRRELKEHGVEVQGEDGEESISFRHELERRIRTREGKESQFFGSTEY